MSNLHASFDRWWNGISLRTKITGVTVLLLTFGLAVVGMGTMTVLRAYMEEKVDAYARSMYDQVRGTVDENGDELVRGMPVTQIIECNVRYQPNGTIVAILDAQANVLCDNVPKDAPQPDFSNMTSSWSVAHDGGGPLPLLDETGRPAWKVKTVFTSFDNGASYVTLVVGADLTEVDNTITRYTLIFFLFAIAVILLGAAVTQLLVTSTFSPLRDVERTAARFAAGDYSQRLGGATPNTEVGRLNRSLNTMLARIDRAFAERQRAIEQMRRFVGDASHELRTPLVSLRGYAELYRMGALQKPEDVAQAMERIEKEAIRMGGLVEDLLELARLDESRPLNAQPVDLLPIAQDAALDASASNPGRTITVVVPEPIERTEAPTPAPPAPAAPQQPVTNTTGPLNFGSAFARLRRRRPASVETSAGAVQESTSTPLPDVGPIVLGDENKLRQVVTNLMGNAMRFTPDDSPIELAVGVDHDGGYGQISIIDHGEGIPPQLREKIFQRFWRADTSRTRETGGSGLGLAIVAGIVAQHEGHVEALETPGGGATFRVSIPLLPRTEEAEPSPEAAQSREADAPRP